MQAYPYILLIGAVGFVLGYWAARMHAPARRITTGFIVGLVAALTPALIGVVGS